MLQETINSWNSFALEDLYRAYFDCIKNKAGTENAKKFKKNLYENLEKLYEELVGFKENSQCHSVLDTESSNEVSPYFSESLNNSHPNPLSTERGNGTSPPQLRGKADEVSKGELGVGNIMEDAEKLITDSKRFSVLASQAQEGHYSAGQKKNNNSYQIGRSICFITTNPKLREIFAADFRDRIIHHLLVMKIEPIIAPSFVYESSASQKEKGILFAQDRLYKHIQSCSENFHKKAYYLQLDIKSFFPSIKKDILWNLLDGKIIDGFYKDLLKEVLYNDPTENYYFKGDKKLQHLVPKYKSLFFTGKNVGLPIGNLTSQFFANVYLNELDNFVKRELKCKYYVRYVDDFVLVSQDKEQLKIWKEKIKAYVKEKLDIEVNGKKVVMQEISQGIDFVGAVLKPYHRYARTRIFSNFERVLWRLDSPQFAMQIFPPQTRGVEKNPPQMRGKASEASRGSLSCETLSPQQLPHILSQLNSYMGFIKHSSYKKRFFEMYKRYSKSLNQYFSLDIQRMCFVLRE